MRHMLAVLVLALTTQSYAEEYVDGVVIVRLAVSQAHPTHEVLSSDPPQFGIAAIDTILTQFAPYRVLPFLPFPLEVESEAIESLSRTYLVYYSEDVDPSDVVAELEAISAIEIVEANPVVTKYYSGARRVELNRTGIVGGSIP